MTGPRPPPRIFPRPSGSACPLPGQVEGSTGKQVDSWGGGYGVQASLGPPGSPCDFNSPGFSASCFPGSPGSFRTGNSPTLHQRSSRGDLSLSGFLREIVCGEEEFRGFPPRAGFVPPEQVSDSETVQDGDKFVDPGGDSSWGLGHHGGPAGRLFSCPDPREGQEISTVLLEGSDLSIQGSPLRPLASSLGFHQSDQRASDRPEVQGNQDPYVPRRLDDSGPIVQDMFRPHPSGDLDSQRARILSPPGEVLPHPLPDIHFPRNVIRHPSLYGFSHRGPNQSFRFSEGQTALLKRGISPSPALSFGPDGIYGSPPSLGPLAQERVSKTTQSSLESIPGFLGLSSQHPGLAKSSSLSVDGSFLAQVGCSDLSPLPGGGALYGRVVRGLGCPCCRPDSCGHMVSVPEVHAHQCSGIGSGSFSYPTVCRVPCSQSCPALHGQHNCCMLCEQAGGHPSPLPLQESRNASSFLSRKEDPSQSKACSRQTQYHCGLPEQTSLCPPHRMDVSEKSTPASVGHMAQTYDRPFRYQVQQSPSVICFPPPGPRCVGSGRPLIPVDRAPGLRFPPDPNSGQSDPKGKTRGCIIDPDLPSMASSALVSRSPPTGPLTSPCAVPEQECSGSAKIGDSSRQSRGSQPPRVAAVRGSLHSLGASNRVVELVGLAHRPGTQSVYSSHWERWLAWCQDQSIDPIHPSRVDLANFLGFLSLQGKATATIRVYRAAICTTLRQLGGPSFQEDHLIRDTLRGSALLEARSPRRMPSWDLNLVLSYLKGPNFSPLNSLDLKQLTLKTAFLLALASGRRVSEVNHLSGLTKDVGLDPQGAYVLRFLPDFLAKNQSPGSPSPSLTIPPLVEPSVDSSPDVSLCPVRTLKRYRQLTKPLRANRRKLLLSFNPTYRKDITVASVSRWIREVIKGAYAAEERDMLDHNPRAHEVRAWAASLAFSHSCSLLDVLQAAYWRSSSPFIKCYLRDVTIVHEDGSMAISCVAAQARISSSV